MLQTVDMSRGIFSILHTSFHINRAQTPMIINRRTKANEDCSVENSRTGVSGPPNIPSTCCMSGCANCVWLDYAEETVKYYDALGETMNFQNLIDEVSKNIDDPMIKAFITMELKSKYIFSSRNKSNDK